MSTKQLGKLLLQLVLITNILCHDLDKYLSARLNFVNDELSGHNILRRDAQNSIHFNEEKSVTLPGRHEGGHTFRLFNNTYLVLDHELFEISPRDNEFVLLSRLKFAKLDGKIDFIQPVEYNDIGLLFVVPEHGMSKLYSYVHDEPVFIQALKAGDKITDAKFFINDANLYLAIASSLKSISYYKWEGTHLDLQTETIIDGAEKITTFQYEESEIIIVKRNIGLVKTNCYVYEFNSNKSRKIQILDNAIPSHVNTFLAHDKRYIVVFDEGGYNTLYWWNGMEFTPFQNFGNTPGFQKIVVAYTKNVPLILASNNDTIYIYTLHLATIQLVATYNYKQNISSIFDLGLIDQENEDLLFTLARTQSAPLSFDIIPFTFNLPHSESQIREGDDLLECFQELDVLIENNNKESNHSKVYHEKMVQTNEVVDGGEEQVAASAFAQTSPDFIEHPDTIPLESQISILEQKLAALQQQFTNHDDTVVDGKLIVQAGITARKMVVQNLQLNVLNAITWAPNGWLLYSQEQTLLGEFNIKNLFVDDLRVPENDIIFEKMLLLNASSQELQGAKLGSLHARNIRAPIINQISMNDVYLRSQPVKVTGAKTVQSLKTDDVLMNQLNGQNASDVIKLFGDPKAVSYDFLPNLKIKNLLVENINTVDWKQFTENVFRVGHSETIQGNLEFEDVEVKRMYPKSISGIDSTKLLTLTTNQTIDSLIKFNNVDAPNVVCNKINGLDFEKSVATFGEDATMHISGPVTIDNFQITGNLNINESMHDFYKQNPIAVANARELLQIYNKVKINGNLHLSQNIELANSARLLINGNEFNQGNFNDYWLKTTNQEIPVHFETHKGISTPHLNAKLLNNIPVDDYMLNNQAQKTGTNYIFENVTILGNVIINKTLDHAPDLRKLQQETVMLNGTYVIRGAKQFNGQLRVGTLRADYINDLNTAALATKSSEQIFGTKIFENVNVEGPVNTAKLMTNNINGYNLNDLSADIVFIDEDANFTQLDIAAITSRNLTATNVNNKLFNQYIIEIDQIYLMKYLNKLTINGSAVINNTNEVEFINNVNITQKLVDMNNQGLPDNTIFEGNVHIEELIVSKINEIDFEQLLPKLYSRYWPQNITAKHVFKVVTTPNILTAVINDINVDHLVDVTSSEPQLLIASNGIQLFNPKFMKSLLGDFYYCNINAAAKSIRNISTRIWNSMTITHNMTLLDEESDLGTLLYKSVNAKKENTITAPVTFNHVYAQNITAKNINDINLKEIFEDAVFINSPEEQVITGFKTFGKLATYTAGVFGDINIPYINDKDIVHLNQSIISKADVNDAIIRGRKTLFGGVQAKNVHANFKSGFNTDSLVSLEHLKPIPFVSFDSVEIANNMMIGSVNNQKFAEFLDNRLLINSAQEQVTSALHFFDELVLNGPTNIPYINNIPLDDVVFDEGIQVIRAAKNFNGDVLIIGDAIIDNINGYNLADTYKQSLFADKPANILGNINVEVGTINGNITAERINNVPVDKIQEMLENKNPQIRADIVHDAMENIKGLISENFDIITRLPDQYLYLEMSDKLQIQIPNAVDAQIVSNKGTVMVHVKSEEPGIACGLPAYCPCPSQQTFFITPEFSIKSIVNKMAQRVYSYEDIEVSLHVTTNSKSSSPMCRAADSALHEFTTLTWSTTPVGNRNSSTYVYPDHLTGYISDVQFFNHNGHKYVIIGRYYNPILNTTNVDCLVLRFSKEMDQVEFVQKIPCQGAWTIHVFYTAQGINLIIGNKGGMDYNYGELSTDVYRFDQTTKMFVPLKSILGTGCISATSVVLGYDSLIILAHINSPMQILKYNREYDNYYFYQNFVAEHPVVSVSAFYTGGHGISDAYLTAVSDNSHFYVYSYQYLGGWKLESEGEIEGLRALIPFNLDKISFLFAASTKMSSLLNVVKHG